MSAGCLLSGDPRPCEPCAWCSSVPGSHHPPFYAFCQCPSCGTCGGEKSPICCDMVKAGCWGGTQALGVGSGHFAILFRGGLGRTPAAAVTSATAWLAIQDSSGLPGGEPKAHLFVGVQCQRGDEGLFQAFSTAVAGIVVHDYYVVQV